MTQTNTQQITTHRSVSTIMVNKVLDNIQNAPISSIINRVMLALSALLIWMGLMFPEQIITALKFMISWNNFATIKLIFSFLIVWNYDVIFEFIRGIKIAPAKIKNDSDTIEGIPVHELLDHLFEFKSFKRDDVEKKFAIPRYKFTELANRFEELGILTRGMNNSRILNPDFGRQDVARVLQGSETVEEIKPVFRKDSESSFTIEPVGKIINAKWSSFFTGAGKNQPAGSFTSRKIGNIMQTSSELCASYVQG